MKCWICEKNAIFKVGKKNYCEKYFNNFKEKKEIDIKYY